MLYDCLILKVNMWYVYSKYQICSWYYWTDSVIISASLPRWFLSDTHLIDYRFSISSSLSYLDVPEVIIFLCSHHISLLFIRPWVPRCSSGLIAPTTLGCWLCSITPSTHIFFLVLQSHFFLLSFLSFFHETS